MKRWQALLAVAGLFVLGTVAGGLGAHLYYARFHRQGPPSPLHGPMAGPRLERLLELSPEQAERLHEALEESRREGEAMRRETMERMRSEVLPRWRELDDRRTERIRAILTPEQSERFDRMVRRERRRFERALRGFRGRPPPGRPPDRGEG